MSSLYLTRGISGSGKTTFAKGWVALDPVNRARVSRDDIRVQLFGKRRGVDEGAVTTAEQSMAEALLRAGRDVIIDATHIEPRFINKWLSFDPDLTVIHVEATVNEALWRDAERPEAERVGKSVIMRQAERLQVKPDGSFPGFEKRYSQGPEYKANLRKPMALIVDTDGTLAKMGDRGPYDMSRIQHDTVDEAVAEMVIAAQESGIKIIGLSGRPEDAYTPTMKWWHDVAKVYPHEFFMRASGDHRPDWVVKAELFDKYIAPFNNVIGALDDRPQVVRMWRRKGVRVFNMGDGTEF